MIKRIAWLLVICCWLFNSQVYATQWLRQSTAVTIKMGPFLDSTNGDTEEVSLTISQADIRLSKNGGAYAQTSNAAGATHDENGLYGVPLNTTDTATLGRLKVYIHESGALAVWETFMVVPANVWDSLFGADILHMSLYEIDNAGSDQSVDDLEDFADAGFDPSSNGVLLQDGTGTGQINLDGGKIVEVSMLTDHTAQSGDSFTLVDHATYGVSNIYSKLADAESGLGALHGILIHATYGLSALRTQGDSAWITAGAADVAGAEVDVTKIHGSALTETAGGRLAAAFVKLFDVVTPLLVASDVMRGTDSAATAGALTTAQNDLDILTGTDGVTLATAQGNYAPAKAGDSMGLSNDAITEAKVHANAWQELIELLFDYDATANYASADAGSLVKQIGSNATVTIPPRIE